MSSLALHKQDIVVPNCDPATWEVGEELKPAWDGVHETPSQNQTNRFSAVFGEEGGSNEAAKKAFTREIKQADQEILS